MRYSVDVMSDRGCESENPPQVVSWERAGGLLLALVAAWVPLVTGSGLVIILAALSGMCGDSSTDAACAAQHHSAEVAAIVACVVCTLAFVAATTAIVCAVLRRVQRRALVGGLAILLAAGEAGVSAATFASPNFRLDGDGLELLAAGMATWLIVWLVGTRLLLNRRARGAAAQ
jgi:hypothetical protein